MMVLTLGSLERGLSTGRIDGGNVVDWRQRVLRLYQVELYQEYVVDYWTRERFEFESLVLQGLGEGYNIGLVGQWMKLVLGLVVVIFRGNLCFQRRLCYNM